MNKNRIEALSDGVFAVAMTLLVFGFRVNVAGPAQLRSALLHVWPQLLAYILSFVIVGVYWVAHHTAFHFIARTNRRLLWCNNLFLMTIAFLPFPASLLGEYPSAQASIVLYGCTLIVANTSLTITWICAERAGLLHAGLPAGYSRFVILVTMTPAAVYAAAVLVSFFNLKIPLVLFAAVPAFFILPFKFVESRVARAISSMSAALL